MLHGKSSIWESSHQDLIWGYEVKVDDFCLWQSKPKETTRWHIIYLYFFIVTFPHPLSESRTEWLELGVFKHWHVVDGLTQNSCFFPSASISSYVSRQVTDRWKLSLTWNQQGACAMSGSNRLINRSFSHITCCAFQSILPILIFVATILWEACLMIIIALLELFLSLLCPAQCLQEADS